MNGKYLADFSRQKSLQCVHNVGPIFNISIANHCDKILYMSITKCICVFNNTRYISGATMFKQIVHNIDRILQLDIRNYPDMFSRMDDFTFELISGNKLRRFRFHQLVLLRHSDYEHKTYIFDGCPAVIFRLHLDHECLSIKRNLFNQRSQISSVLAFLELPCVVETGSDQSYTDNSDKQQCDRPEEGQHCPAALPHRLNASRVLAMEFRGINWFKCNYQAQRKSAGDSCRNRCGYAYALLLSVPSLRSSLFQRVYCAVQNLLRNSAPSVCHCRPSLPNRLPITLARAWVARNAHSLAVECAT